MSYRIKPTLKPIKSVSKVSESWLSRKTGLHPERIQLFWALAMAAFSMIFLAYATHKYFEVFEYDSPAGYMEITPKEFYGPRIPESILKKMKSEVMFEKVGKVIEPKKKAEAKTEFNLDGYIDELFGTKAWVVKNVIIKNESGWNPERQNRGKAGYIKINGRYRKYSGECSIGLAQINLKSDGCNGKKVHWDKVPGTSLNEKVEWLKVPKNNIDMMYILSSNGTNFCPWSTYNGKECGRR